MGDIMNAGFKVKEEDQKAEAARILEEMTGGNDDEEGDGDSDS